MKEAAFFLLASIIAGGINGFDPTAFATFKLHNQRRQRPATAKSGQTAALSASIPADETTLCNIIVLPFGEKSRKLRRTIFSHDDWARHRSPDRFLNNMRSILSSGLYKNVQHQIYASVGIAAFTCLYNALISGYADLQGIHHVGPLADTILPMFSLPMELSTLSSAPLGLLLVFRTNSSYQRWDEARKNWANNIYHARDLVRMASAYYDRKGVPEHVIKDDLERVSLCVWALMRCMKRHLSPAWEDEETFRKELYQKLPCGKQAETLIAALHRPNRALQDLSFAVEALPMHFMRKNEIQRAVTNFGDTLVSNERLLTSPVPLFYSRHTARFTALWLFTLPLALYDTFAVTWNHFGLIPAMAVFATGLFGIEELATQLEEPFTILPMQTFCNKVYNSCTEIVTWEPNNKDAFLTERRDLVEEYYQRCALEIASRAATEKEISVIILPEPAMILSRASREELLLPDFLFPEQRMVDVQNLAATVVGNFTR